MHVVQNEVKFFLKSQYKSHGKQIPNLSIIIPLHKTFENILWNHGLGLLNFKCYFRKVLTTWYNSWWPGSIPSHITQVVAQLCSCSLGLASVGFCCCQSRDSVFGRRPWLLDYDSPFVRLKSSPSPPSGHLLCYYIAPSKYTVYSLHYRHIQSKMK